MADEAGACDVDTANGGITVALKIDDDSGAGTIFVKQTAVTTGNSAADDTDVIEVTVAQVPTALSAKLDATSVKSGQPTGQGRSTLLDIRLTDENGGGIEGKALTIVSTRALLTRSHRGRR